MTAFSWLCNRICGRQEGSRDRTHRAPPRCRPRLELLEDRIVLDAGDTLTTALQTGLGPADGTFTQASEHLGDGPYGAADVDLYRFDAGTNQVLSLATALPPGGTTGATDVRLFDSTGHEVVQFSPDPYVSFTNFLLPAGTYYVGVSGSPNASYNPTVGGSGSPGSTGDYSLTLSLTTLTPDAAGETLATAQVTGLGPANGTFSATAKIGDGVYLASDVDLYQFTATAGEGFLANAQLPTGGKSLTPVLRLFDAAGHILTTPQLSYSNTLPYVFGMTGTYYLGVSSPVNVSYDPTVSRPFNFGGSGQAVGDYTLNLSLVTPQLDNVGETLATALATGLGPTDGSYTMPSAAVGDGFFGSRDVDLYRFDVASPQRFTATLSAPGGGTVTNATMRLFDSTGQSLLPPGDSLLQGTSLLTPGTYYLGVSSSQNGYNPSVANSGTATNNPGLIPYRLDMSLTTLTPDAAGDTLATAQATGLGSDDGSFAVDANVGDGLFGKRDVDLYRFDAVLGQELSAVTSAPAGSSLLGSDVRLFDQAGHLLPVGFTSFGAPFASIVNYVFGASGTYYVGVSGSGNSNYNPNVAGSGSIEATGDYHLDLALTNAPPTVTSFTNSAADEAHVAEDRVVSVSGTFTDPGPSDTHTAVIDWGDGTTSMATVTESAGAGSLAATHTYVVYGVYTLTATVTDNAGGAGTQTTTALVYDLPPTITQFSTTAPDASQIAENRVVSVFGTFTDPGPSDTHTAVIDWGDGTTSIATVTETAGAGSLAAKHTYASGGIFAVTVTVTDSHGEAVTATSQAVASGAWVHDGVLHILGTNRDDDVAITSEASQIVVHAGFLKGAKYVHFPAVGISEIHVEALGGNDRVEIANEVRITTILDGGSGNDALKAGGGPSVILGREGDDTLTGGSGRDILIGGDGTDHLQGQRADDILIGGLTTWDDDAFGLLSLLAEWNSASDYATRVDALENGAGLTNGYYLYPDWSVYDDGNANVLDGGTGQDLFFIGVLDKMRHPGRDETVFSL